MEQKLILPLFVVGLLTFDYSALPGALIPNLFVLVFAMEFAVPELVRLGWLHPDLVYSRFESRFCF